MAPAAVLLKIFHETLHILLLSLSVNHNRRLPMSTLVSTYSKEVTYVV